MKKSTLKKTEASPLPPEPVQAPPTVTSSFLPDEYEMPDPERLLEEALGEPSYHNISMYRSSICVLKRKGFSFREIAQWLSNRGINSDHNSVYRVYLKGMSDDEIADFQQREQEEAEEEAERNR